MDFTFNDEQTAVREAVTSIFSGLVNPDRVQEVEATEDRVDADLWAELARADLLGLAVPEAHGGGGFGMVELCLLLEAQGRVAPCPSPSSAPTPCRQHSCPAWWPVRSSSPRPWPTWPTTSPWVAGAPRP
jgi:alkylation response protein AidB-like acyl-CoA dehydrogenase